MKKMTYNVRETAQILGISKSYAYELVKEKKLPVLELGKRRVVPKSALKKWMQEQVNM
ncbi:helix-turn-helix domain-containing protein [Hespellia stercorisuis]|uniref:DNA binding domain-containing protein, excisionase family n=1 Tax=Hespellia stercorisuis DSM 15480 TaxID=1121950 RepID=A0A1M6NVJ7_9FIRM|nr:helix-turn-helix domain-containing protein [Hespellia stercorisuis]SHJ99644.1 DNA binding domain-containing protein, excisionase family [Hespellia stercorisuis DSM 15480]